MSVITEVLEGDEIVIISKFVIYEDGMEFDWKHAREFDIGERVYFIDFFEDKNVKQEYNQWFVRFKTKEGKVYSAIQHYFISKYDWEDIVEHIKTQRVNR